MPRARHSRPGERDRLALPFERAARRLQQAIDHLDQGGLAGTVLAEQRVHLGRPDFQVDAVVRDEVAIELGDADRFEQRYLVHMGRFFRYRRRRHQGVSHGARDPM